VRTYMSPTIAFARSLSISSFAFLISLSQQRLTNSLSGALSL
jgi:hypothetical protein